jgi:hypothetical protein
MQLSNFHWVRGAASVDWTAGGVAIHKSYSGIQSAVCLRDQTGVAIVISHQSAGRNNAFVLNADGTERFRIEFPSGEHLGYWFAQVYYVGTELTAFANVDGWDKAYVIDEATGKILRSYESR